jgi:menaquinol-cytochrome c reductase iron-sulfur subunit
MDEQQTQISRRRFHAMAIWAIGGFISAGMAIPALAYIIGPALQSTQAQEWVRLGSTTKVELGVPTLFKVTVEQQTAWIKNEQEISVYVLTENGRDYEAISNICTHLGCRVRWVTERNQYICPCHNGQFDKQGLVVAGPPPRPLDRYSVRVEGDQLFIKAG